MKSGIYLSKKTKSPSYLELKKFFKLEQVSSVTALSKKLGRQKIDFVYIDIKSESDVLKAIQNLFKTNPNIVAITHHEYQIPQIDCLYTIDDKDLIECVLEILSFHQAKSKNELQTVYGIFDERGHDYFYLSEHSPLGIVLADSEGDIFYINDAGKSLIDYDEEKRFLKQYLKFDHTVEDLMHDRQSELSRFYEYVETIDSDTILSVLHKDISTGREIIGSIYYLEDVTEKQLSAKRIFDEKEKFERLTARLNDVLLKDLGSNVYNLAYIKRKIDLEIKHAQKSQSEIKFLHYWIDEFDQKISDHSLRKSILSQSARFLLESFPDPHIVGSLSEGHWLVILQDDFIGISEKRSVVAKQMSLALNESFGDLNLKVNNKQYVDLKRFKNSQELIEKLQAG